MPSTQRDPRGRSKRELTVTMDAMRQVYQSSVSSGSMKRSIRELKNKVYDA